MKDPSSNLFVDDHIKIAQIGTNRSSTADQLYNEQSTQAHQQYVNQQNQQTVAAANNEFEYTNAIALNYIWPTVPIGFLILGTVANLLSIIVFRRREMKKFSSFCYFFYLNCVNLAVLYITMVRVISEFNFKYDIRRFSLVLYTTFLLFCFILIIQ